MASEIANGRAEVDVRPADTGNTKATILLVGGFGALRGSSCPGIERVTLHVANDDTTPEGVGSSDASVSLRKDGLLTDVPSPTWLTRHGDTMYAVLEDTNEVAAFRIDAGEAGDRRDIRLIPLSRVHTPGASPTHAAVVVDDLGGEHLLVANYADGHVCVHPIAADGSVLAAAQVLEGEGHGPLPAQEGPHAHWILPLPDGRVLSTDLGADRIHVHRWESGRLVRVGEVRITPGTGPRDLHLLPVPGAAANGDDWRVAVVGEWADTVTLLGPVPNGSSGADGSDGIRVLQTVGLGGDHLDQAASLAFVPWTALRHDSDDATADDDTAGSTRGLAYVGLRGSERIVALAWDGERLSRLAPEDEPGWRGRGVDCGGSRPRHILPVGNLLLVANEVSNDVTVFHLASDGEPTRVAGLPSGSPTVFARL
ncbi:carboxy-cis,cis-muconate cyclase [Bifidobacterium callitrichos]|uniref:Carboxy-cis,cis-muconate cyclase n=1 Tax=Bifidobacterium callitrichos TaxID=762209 RepID=A0A2T3GB99_9BIFI|nr:beta-propeller fold lactonase family protein [Bifidobacterium callitrichos]PST46742.1 carboxy-cis,cis-muconate cyclase [Bifidobacterium callitrichos]